MFISIPKDFFVPVLFSDEFRYNSEDDTMEYDTEENKLNHNINRKRLQDLGAVRGESGGDSVGDSEITPEYVENLININDKKIEEQILKYSYSFIKFLDELKKANCLGNSEADIKSLVNYYANGFRKLYYQYKNLVSEFVMPISSSDEDGIIDKFIGELEDLYNKNIEDLNCKNLNLDAIDATTDEIFNNARDVLKEEIENINCEIVNKITPNKSEEEIRNAVNNADNIYKKLDEEYAMEMEKVK